MKSSKILNIKDLSGRPILYYNRHSRGSKKVNLKLNKGEFPALVGESGSIKKVTGFKIPQLFPGNTIYLKGSILFEGVDILEQPVTVVRGLRGSCISMIFQELMTFLNSLHTVKKQIRDIIEQGTAQQIFEEPKEAYTKTLLAATLNI